MEIIQCIYVAVIKHDLVVVTLGVITGSQQLKAVDTIGNCQRLAFTVGVSQHMHKITNL